MVTALLLGRHSAQQLIKGSEKACAGHSKGSFTERPTFVGGTLCHDFFFFPNNNIFKTLEF